MSNAENPDPAEVEEPEEADDPLDLSKAYLSMTFVGLAGMAVVGIILLLKSLA